MSGQESFLSRWSRRKRDGAEADAPAKAPAAAEPAPPEPSAAAQTASASQAASLPKAADTEPALFDPASLPPIESITAETDIRGFLAPGVPEDLKLAALRRAWSADPAIRDFIGLSENSWDFNDPQAMGGFGPLAMSDDLRRMVAELFTPSAERSAAGSAAVHGQERPVAPPPVGNPEDMQVAAARQEENADHLEYFPPRDELSQDGTNIAASQQSPLEGDVGRTTGRRCHGGALPK